MSEIIQEKKKRKKKYVKISNSTKLYPKLSLKFHMNHLNVRDNSKIYEILRAIFF